MVNVARSSLWEIHVVTGGGVIRGACSHFYVNVFGKWRLSSCELCRVADSYQVIRCTTQPMFLILGLKRCLN